MRLLLTSFQHPSMAQFIGGKRVAYVPDAARSYADAPFVQKEREGLEEQGLELINLPLSHTDLAAVETTLNAVDGVYVAGGETFDLLHVLRSTGSDKVITRRVRQGLPYIGCSAGSVVAGPTIEAVSLMDSPDIAPDLKDYTGLGLTELAIIPHASGSISQFPIETIADTVRTYGERWPLCLLRDGQALWVEDGEVRLLG